jgi:hypothetical protein
MERYRMNTLRPLPEPKTPLWAYPALLVVGIVVMLWPRLPAVDIFGDGSR